MSRERFQNDTLTQSPRIVNSRSGPFVDQRIRVALFRKDLQVSDSSSFVSLSRLTLPLFGRFGIATLVFAWISTILLIAFVAFLIVWSVVNRHGQGELSIYKSIIKARYVGGEIRLPAEAGMANSAPAAPPVSTSHPTSPIVVAAP